MRSIARKHVTILVVTLAMALVVACTGGGWHRSWDSLVSKNGFSGPIEVIEVTGDAQYTFVVTYGQCRIRIITADPWYKDPAYPVTYLPNNEQVPPVEDATAYKLGELPETYDLDECQTTLQR